MSERAGEQKSLSERFGAAANKEELLSVYLDICEQHSDPDRSLAYWQRKVATKLLALGDTNGAFEFVLAADRTLQVASTKDIAEEMRRIPESLYEVFNNAIGRGSQTLAANMSELREVEGRFSQGTDRFTQALEGVFFKAGGALSQITSRFEEAVRRSRY